MIKRIGIFTIVAIIVAALVFNYIQNHSSDSALSSAFREKTPEELRIELAQKEKENPEAYLQDQTTMRTNLIGEKVIEGTVTNTASVAIYKDIILNVTFMSKTEADLGSREFKIYEVVSPGQSVHFKFKTIAPSDTEAFSASVLGASASN